MAEHSQLSVDDILRSVNTTTQTEPEVKENDLSIDDILRSINNGDAPKTDQEDKSGLVQFAGAVKDYSTADDAPPSPNFIDAQTDLNQAVDSLEQDKRIAAATAPQTPEVPESGFAMPKVDLGLSKQSVSTDSPLAANSSIVKSQIGNLLAPKQPSIIEADFSDFTSALPYTAEDGSVHNYENQQLDKATIRSFFAKDKDGAYTLPNGKKIYSDALFEKYVDEYYKRYNHPILMQDEQYRRNYILHNFGKTEERFIADFTSEINAQLDRVERAYIDVKKQNTSVEDMQAEAWKDAFSESAPHKPEDAVWRAIGDTRKKINSISKDNFWRGFAETFSIDDIAAYGLPGLQTAAYQLSSLNKYLEGKPLTAEEKLFVEVSKLSQQIDQFRGEFGNDSGMSWSRVGNIVGFMPQFALQLGITGNIIPQVGQKAVKDITVKTVMNTLKESTGKGLAMAGKKIGIAALNDAIGTPFMTMSYKNLADRRLRHFQWDGESLVKEQTPWAVDLVKALGETFVERHSEQIGMWITDGLMYGAKKMAQAKFLDNAFGRGVRQVMNYQLPPVLEQLRKNLRIGGYIGEVGSEIYNNLINPFFTGETDSWKELLTSKYYWELCTSMAISTGAFYSLGIPSYVKQARIVRNLNQSRLELLSSISNQQLKDLIQTAFASDNLEVGIADLTAVDWTNISKQDAQAASEYIFKTINAKLLDGEMVEAERLQAFLPMVQNVSASLYSGGNISSPQAGTQLRPAILKDGSTVFMQIGDIQDANTTQFIVRTETGEQKIVGRDDIVSATSVDMSDYIAQQYNLLFSDSINKERLRSFINDLHTAQENNASAEAISTLFNRSGYVLFNEGETVTLTNGATGVVVGHANGHYVIADPANPQMTASVGFLNILQPDIAVAEVQAEVAQEIEDSSDATPTDIYVSEEDVLTQKLNSAAKELATQGGDISIIRLGDGREATVKQGNIVTNPDGSIDTESSDGTIVIKTADSTELQQISIEDVDAVIEHLATSEVVEMAKNNIEEQIAKRNLIETLLQQNGVADVILIGNITGQIVGVVADGTYAFNWVGEDNAIHTLPVTLEQIQEVLPPKTEPVVPEEAVTTTEEDNTEVINEDAFEGFNPKPINFDNVDWDNISTTDYINLSILVYGPAETLARTRVYYLKSKEKIEKAQRRVEAQNAVITKLRAKYADLAGPGEAVKLDKKVSEAEAEKVRRIAAVSKLEQEVAKYAKTLAQLGVNIQEEVIIINERNNLERQKAELLEADANLDKLIEQGASNTVNTIVNNETTRNRIYNLYVSRGMAPDQTGVTSAILWDIVTGNLHLRWEDYKTDSGNVEKGLASELGLTNSAADKRAYKAVLDKNGISVDSYVHSLWERMGGYSNELDDMDIKNEVLSVLQSTPNGTVALQTLYDALGIEDAVEDAYSMNKVNIAQQIADIDKQIAENAIAQAEFNKKVQNKIDQLEGKNVPDATQYSQNNNNFAENNDTDGRKETDIRRDNIPSLETGANNSSSVDTGVASGETVLEQSGDNISNGRGDIRVFEQGLGSERSWSDADNERAIQQAVSQRLVEIAQENGLFIPLADTKNLGEKYQGRTGESTVYINKTAGKVYKVKNPYAKSALKKVAPQDAIYEHIIHNLIFPEVPYKFEGISKDVDGVRIILSQPYIKDENRPSQSQIEQALAARGLYPDGRYSYGNDWVSVTDVEGDNVILGEDGTVYFIDPIIKFKKPATEIIKELSTVTSPIIETGVLDARAERQAIIEQAKANGTWLKAPNGQPTNLSEEQWVTVRTQAFINWFGDWINDPQNASKVLDENGEPLVVYHYSPNSFTEFKMNRFGETSDGGAQGKGFYFSPDIEYAKKYGSNGIAAFLNIRNYIDANKNDFLAFMFGSKNLDGAVERIYGPRLNYMSAEEKAQAKEQISQRVTPEMLAELAQYDGTYLYEKSASEWVAGAPSQIKSATDNFGTFDPNNNDIRFMFGNEDIATIEKKTQTTSPKLDAIVDHLNDILGNDNVVTDEAEMRRVLDSAMPDEVANMMAPSDNIFYSNAEQAVREIKQEKATPQQWLAMLQKNGGLKAGEDKWIGLSDWLRSSDKKTLTKQEVLDYIRANKIQIEEVQYGVDYIYGSAEFEALQKKYNDTRERIYKEKAEAFDRLSDELIVKYGFKDGTVDMDALSDDDYAELNQLNVTEWGAVDLAWQELVDEYGDDFEIAFSQSGYDIYIDDIDAASSILGLYGNYKEINQTRLRYTTEGLTNKREIALTVPTIDSWKENDEIHFGDAGQGRAIAWVRFGETTAPREVEVVREVDLEAPFKAYNGHDIYRVKGTNGKHFIIYGKLRNGQMMYVPQINGKYIGETIETAAFDTLEQAQEALVAYYKAHPIHKTINERVLVIDEIQSNRHQEGRKRGYESKEDKAALDAIIAAREELGREQRDFEYRTGQAWQRWQNGEISEQEYNEMWNTQFDAENKTLREKQEAVDAQLSEYKKRKKPGVIPAAPFESNWAELTFKRMLRYAAENGFDKIAWTTGAQQAERYSLNNYFSSVVRWDINTDDMPGRYYTLNGTVKIGINVNEDGQIISASLDELVGKPLSDVVGKEVAVKMMEMEDRSSLEDIEFQIGGEGMKAFYDKMLVSFMNKYGKKWGVRVGEVTMPELNEENATMHSVDVTPAMRESVMQGQPMFMKTSKGEVYGFTYKGKIYLDLKSMTLETPLHEYTELWSSVIAEQNPMLWAKGKELLRQTETWRQVNNDPNYRNLSEDLRASETLSRIMAAEGAKKINEVTDNKNLIAKLRAWIRKFWNALKATFSRWSSQDIASLSLREFKMMPLRDFIEGINPLEHLKDIAYTEPMAASIDAMELEDIRAERRQIEEQAKANGTWLKAPNGQPTNLTPEQWVTVRTRRFKEWFGDWLKTLRVEKLRNSEVVSISGQEFEITDDFKQNKKNALKYSQSFTGEYTNADTGATIAIYRGRHNGGVNEVLQHNYKDIPHIQSIAAIPQIIEKSIYIESQPNNDIEKNPDITEYQCYVCGLNIAGEDYTVLAKIAVDTKGNRYYDHNLTAIEKGKLIDIANNEQSAVASGFGTTPDTKSTTNSQRKYREFLSILQTNASKIVDANGEPMPVYHGSTADNITEFDKSRIRANETDANYNGFWFSTDEHTSPAWRNAKRIYTVFLNIKNPIVRKDANKVSRTIDYDVIEKLQKEGKTVRSLPDATRYKLQQLGYDGVIDFTPAVINEQEFRDTGRTLFVMADGYAHILSQTNDGIVLYEYDPYAENKEGNVEGIYDSLEDFYNDSYYFGESIFVAFEPNQIKSVDNTGTFDSAESDIRYSQLSAIDAEYMEAVRSGNMERAKELVRQYAETRGYTTSQSFRDAHGAPVATVEKKDFTNAELINQQSIDDSTDVNLFSLPQGENLAPNDFWSPQGPRWYMYNDDAGMQAYAAISSAIRSINYQLSKYGEVRDIPTVKVYRAVPNSVEATALQNGDWVTPSKLYADRHGKARFGFNEYKIIEQEVPATELWWDGNDAREWGYDNGNVEATANTPNNVKLLDPITYDDNGNIIPLSSRFDRTNSDIRFMFVGEKGAAAMDAAEEATIRLDNLAIAREMESVGKDAKSIKLATGWERGADGKWRYEVPDDYNLDDFENRIRERLAEDERSEEEKSTWGIVYNDNLGTLIDAYPDFNVDIIVYVGNQYNNTGSYEEGIEGDESYFGRSPQIEIKAKTVEDVKAILVHEIQHAIQEIEGFAQGGNSFGLNKRLETELNRLTNEINTLRAAGKNDEADAIIKSNKGLVEAVINNDRDEFGNYRKLAGEVEARNASARMNMTPEERRASLASETQDVATEDQIFIYNSFGTAQQAATPKPKTQEEKLQAKIADLRVELNDKKKNLKSTLVRIYDFLTSADILNAMETGVDRQQYRAVVKNITTAIEQSYGKSDLTVVRAIVDKYLWRIEDTLARVLAHRRLNELTKILNTAVEGYTPQGVRFGKRIDDNAREVFKLIRDYISEEFVEETTEDNRRKPVKYRLKNRNEDGDISTSFRLKTSGRIADLRSEADDILAELGDVPSTEDVTKASRLLYIANILDSYDRTLELNEQIGQVAEEITDLESRIKQVSVAHRVARLGSQEKAQLWDDLKALRFAKESAIQNRAQLRKSYAMQLNTFVETLNALIEKGSIDFKSEQEGKVKEEIKWRRGIYRSIKDPSVKVLPNKEYTREGKKKPRRSGKRFKRGLINENLFMGTFANLSKEIDIASIPGYWLEDGFYYQFMLSEDGYMYRSDWRYRTKKQIMEQVEAKVKSIFGKTSMGSMIKAQSTSALNVIAHEAQKESGFIIHQLAIRVDDRGRVVGGYQENIPLTIANLLYIRNTVRQRGGKSGYVVWGISETRLDDIVEYVESKYPEYCRFADYVVNELLPELYEMQDAIYYKRFDTHLTQTEFYFPIVRDKRFVGKLPEVGEGEVVMPSSVTGNIVERVKTSAKMDLSADMFSVLRNHIKETLDWCAYSELTRKFNMLSTSRAFRNMMEAQDFSAEKLKQMYEVAIGQGQINSTDETTMTKVLNSISKSLVAGNLTFNLNAAIKQVISMTAILGYTADPKFLPIWAKNYLVPSIAKLGVYKVIQMINEGTLNPVEALDYKKVFDNWQWGLENIPTLRARWESRNAGFEVFKAEGLDRWDKVVKWITNIGLTPNAFVDLLTCANGARSVYEYQYAENIKKGLSKEQAHKDACVKAAVCVNETQQSGLDAFLSSFQAGGGFARIIGVGLGAYQNTSMSFARNEHYAADQIFRMLRAATRQRMIDTKIEEYRTIGYDYERAKRLAKKEFWLSFISQVNSLLHNGVISNFAWTLGGTLSSILAALFAGTVDWDEWNKFWDNEAVQKQFASIFSLSTLLWQFPLVYNHPIAKQILTHLQALRNGQSFGNTFESPVSSEVDDLLEVISKQLMGVIDENTGETKMQEPIKVEQTIEYIVWAYALKTGTTLNQRILSNIASGIKGMIEDGVDTEDIMNILSSPRGLTRAVAGEPREGESQKEYLDRMSFVYRMISAGTGDYDTKWQRERIKEYVWNKERPMYIDMGIDPLEVKALDSHKKAISKSLLIQRSGKKARIKDGKVEVYKLLSENAKKYQTEMLVLSTKIGYIDLRLESMIEFDAERAALLRQRYDLEKELYNKWQEYQKL